MGSMPTQNPRVAFLGLGAMGFAMSTHLVRQSIPVTGFDIFGPTLDRWKQACTSIAETETPTAKFDTATSPAEAVKSADIVVLMVATYQHVDSALFDPEIGAIKNIGQDVSVIIMATVPPMHPLEVRKRLDTEFSRPDIKLVDAPVSGGVARSKNGSLTIMASSNDPSNLTEPTVNFVLSNLASNGATLYLIPGTLGAGTSAKALNQVMCGIHIVAGSEFMSLAALNGLNTTQFYDAVTERDESGETVYGWTWMLENRGPRMLDHTLPIASATSIINKDVGIIVNEEERLNIKLPLLNTAHSVLAECMSKGLAAVDDALITKYYLDPSLSDDIKQNLVVDRSKSSKLTAEEQTSQTKLILSAHAIVHFISAYETFKFAESLDLLGEKQRDMWFRIISGAAGGSTVFSEVIPRAFSSMPNWQSGFRTYAKEVCCSWDLTGIESLVAEAKQQQFTPVLLDTALGFLKEMAR